MRSNISVTLATVTMVCVIPLLVIIYSLQYFAFAIPFGMASLDTYGSYMADRTPVVLPLMAAFYAVVLIVTRFLAKAQRKLARGEALSEEERRGVAEKVRNIPIIIVICCTVPFFLGGTLIALRNPVRFPPFSAEFLLYIAYNVSFGFFNGFFAVAIQDVFLWKAIAKFEVFSIDRSKRTWFRNNRTYMSMIALGFYYLLTIPLQFQDLAKQAALEATLRADSS